MDISNPKRILAISLEREAQLLSQVIKDLTGSHPEPHPGTSSLAGTSHNLALNTAYYKAKVPIWIDLVASASEWAISFTSPEAKEVLDVLGGVVVIFPVTSLGAETASNASSLPYSTPLISSAGSDHITPEEKMESTPPPPRLTGGNDDGDNDKAAAIPESTASELIREVGRVMEALGGWGWDGVGLGIGVGGTSEEADAFDDACTVVGLEFVHAAGKKEDGEKNEFGEKIGMDRALEALQANDWSLGLFDDDDDDEFGEFERPGNKTGPTEGAVGDNNNKDGEVFDAESLDFGFDRKDFEGLRKAIWSGGDGNENDEPEVEVGEEDVEKLERMMMKLQAVRDMSDGLSEEQRKKMAKKAVGEVMKEL